MTPLRFQVKLKRIHRQKKKTNRLKKAKDQLFNRKELIYLYKTNDSSTKGYHTPMELRNITVGLRQQVQHSHHADPNPKFSEP